MATNKLIPFANGVGANVISFERWLELTTTLNNGFSSGIASSEQFNRLLAQGASAGYVIGKIIVDGLNVDADPLDADALAANFKQALDFLPINGGTMKGTIAFQTVTGTNSKTLIQAQMADSDYFRIRVSGTATDGGFAEIATADNGNEPIYIRQYQGAFATLTRTLTLLDASGNTYAPGTVTATGGFVGNLTGRATSSGTADVAIKANQDRNGAVIDETYSPILVGELKWYAGRTVPNGYLLCDGRAVSRTTYSRLFQAIGTIYGSGDGSTTFNLPNGNGRTLQGGAASQVGSYLSAGLPGITHTHSGTTASAGSHNHTASSASAGAHVHSASSAKAGTHTHTASTGATGAHTHDKGTFEITGEIQTPDDVEPSGAFYRKGFLGNEEGGKGKQQIVGFEASRAWTGSTSSNGQHSHTVTVNSNGEHNHSVTVQSAGAHTHGVTVNSNGAHTHTFTTGNNSGVNAIYGASSTVQPPAMIGMLIIKY
jgi:microcystin-dependent protein